MMIINAGDSYPNLTPQIPPGHAMLLFWVRTNNDSRDTASDVGRIILPSRGIVQAAKDADSLGTYGAAAGHGVTILFHGGRSRNVRA